MRREESPEVESSMFSRESPFVKVSLGVCLPLRSPGLLVYALSSLMLLTLKIQGSGGIGAKDLTPFFILEVQRIDLADRFKIAHRHWIIRSDHYSVRADDLDQVL